MSSWSRARSTTAASARSSSASRRTVSASTALALSTTAPVSAVRVSFATLTQTIPPRRSATTGTSSHQARRRRRAWTERPAERVCVVRAGADTRFRVGTARGRVAGRAEARALAVRRAVARVLTATSRVPVVERTGTADCRPARPAAGEVPWGSPDGTARRGSHPRAPEPRAAERLASTRT